MKVGDIDNDNDLDLIYGTKNGNQTRVYTYNGVRLVEEDGNGYARNIRNSSNITDIDIDDIFVVDVVVVIGVDSVVVVVIVDDVDDVVVIVITVVVHHRSKLGHQRIIVKRQGRH